MPENVKFVQVDLANQDTCRSIITSDVSIVFHLASLVSGGAEKDFKAGMEANVHVTINLLEACRQKKGEATRFLFTSSIATFGGDDLPDVVDDWTFQHPQSSYGVAKVIGEQLLNDYSRKGYIDGRGVRFPAIVVRDRPNTAVSGYVSNLIREPLQGRDYMCPVKAESKIPIAGVNKAIQFLIALSMLDSKELGSWRTINGCGISPNVSEIIGAVKKYEQAGYKLGKIEFCPDPEIQKIIDTWPSVMLAERAASLGMPKDESIDELITDYLQESPFEVIE
jgi:nucleoside-diphosphate-sugar epimerase